MATDGKETADTLAGREDGLTSRPCLHRSASEVIRGWTNKTTSVLDKGTLRAAKSYGILNLSSNHLRK